MLGSAVACRSLLVARRSSPVAPLIVARCSLFFACRSLLDARHSSLVARRSSLAACRSSLVAAGRSGGLAASRGSHLPPVQRCWFPCVFLAAVAVSLRHPCGPLVSPCWIIAAPLAAPLRPHCGLPCGATAEIWKEFGKNQAWKKSGKNLVRISKNIIKPMKF